MHELDVGILERRLAVDHLAERDALELAQQRLDAVGPTLD